LPDGAVVVRGADVELQLQGLRTALSLALGDRPAAVYLVGEGVAVLTVAAESEAGRCLAALQEAGIPLVVEAEAAPVVVGSQHLRRAEMLGAIARSEFQQTF
jgi:hypothetical protein